MLDDLVQKELKAIIKNLCHLRKCDILALKLMLDQVHLLLEVDPQYGIHKLIKEIKGKSSRDLRLNFPHLRSHLNYALDKLLFCVHNGRSSFESNLAVCGEPKSSMIQVQLSLFIEADTKTIPLRSNNVLGIDPCYKSTLKLPSGEKIDKPKQLQRAEKRLGDAQRGKRKQLTARLQERIKNRRKDNIKGIAKSYGKSVAEASHQQLRKMLSYKCTASGRKYIEADSKGSTMTCFPCLAKTSPTGKAGLSVRQWRCAEWGSLHDCDQKAAINTFLVGLGTSLERCA